MKSKLAFMSSIKITIYPLCTISCSQVTNTISKHSITGVATLALSIPLPARPPLASKWLGRPAPAVRVSDKRTCRPPSKPPHTVARLLTAPREGKPTKRLHTIVEPASTVPRCLPSSTAQLETKARQRKGTTTPFATTQATRAPSATAPVAKRRDLKLADHSALESYNERYRGIKSSKAEPMHGETTSQTLCLYHRLCNVACARETPLPV